MTAGEPHVALCRRLRGGLVGEVVVYPEGSVVDGAPLVVELRVEQHQPRDLLRLLGGIVGAHPAGEARPEQGQFARTGCFPEVGQRNADVVEDAGQREVFLTTLALPVAAKVEAQGSNARVGQAVRKTREEAALFASDAAAVNEHDGPRAWLSWLNQDAA